MYKEMDLLSYKMRNSTEKTEKAEHSFLLFEYQSYSLIPQCLCIICHGVNDSSLAVHEVHDKDSSQEKRNRRKDVSPCVLFSKKEQGFLTALGKIVKSHITLGD